MIARRVLPALIACLSVLCAAPSPAAAEGRRTLGFGHLFTNDLLGDRYDRWRTGGFSLSIMRGDEWTGKLPDRAFRLLEYRFGSEIIAPANLTAPSPHDRRYAGILSVGLSTHFALGASEVSAGLGLAAVGPGTGLGRLQHHIHKAFGYPDPGGALAGQIPDRLIPTAEAEIGRSFALSPAVQFRPFAEARAGDETMLRIGADLMIGALDNAAFFVRDDTTGYRVTAISPDPKPGAIVILGADIAHVFASEWLPDRGVPILENTRPRVRAGVSYREGGMGLFYGLTWLGREFQGQKEGQVLGSLRVDFAF
jgi:Uncharacterized protein conserved in bacteria (DUF2219)